MKMMSVEQAFLIATVITVAAFICGGLSGVMWAIAISTVIGVVVSGLLLLLEIFGK